jgi:[acyl-carrier-protein] S-malonyltransferase
MNSAAAKMKQKIDNTNFKQPDCEIISNVTSLPTNNPKEIKNLLFKQIYSKVKWRESILFMGSKKVNDFIEIGPGKVLTGLVKRIMPNSKSFNINSIDDIKNLNNES